MSVSWSLENELLPGDFTGEELLPGDFIGDSGKFVATESSFCQVSLQVHHGP